MPRPRSAERPGDHKTELRLWLRLLTCTTLIENEVRRRLRDNFDITLPRFDLLAQLDRAPNGMTLGELSQRMMVSNGNITGLVDRLVEQGLIARRPLAERPPRADRQPHRRKASAIFRAMARANADWVGEIFAGLTHEGHRGADAAARQDQGVGAQGARRTEKNAMSAANPVTLPLSGYQAPPRAFRGRRQGRDADAQPAGEEEPADLRQLRRDRRPVPRRRASDKGVKAIVVTGAGGNFCSGGDVFEIIEPLTKMNTVELLDFTRMTGDVVKAMRACPQPIIAAIDGVCAGAGAIIAMASDIRIGTPAREGRVPVQPRRALPAATWAPARSCRASSARAAPRNCCSPAAAMGGEEAERWGFFNRLSTPETRARRCHEAGARSRRRARPSPTP